MVWMIFFLYSTVSIKTLEFKGCRYNSKMILETSLYVIVAISTKCIFTHKIKDILRILRLGISIAPLSGYTYQAPNVA